MLSCNKIVSKCIHQRYCIIITVILQADKFYEEHRGKFFQQRLVEFMSSGEFHALVLAHKTEDAVTKWRSLLGFTKCYKTRQKNPDRYTTHSSIL